MILLPASLLALSFLAADSSPVDYVRDIKPIFSKHCAECHGADKQRAGLRLDTAASALRGGNSGPALTPGKSGESLLVKAITGTADVKSMPPKEPRLSAEQVALLKKWIDQGAKAPASEVVSKSTSPERQHWAFQMPRRVPPPAARNESWVRNSIDRFMLARLEKQGIAPSPEADPVTLLRRVYLDLIGLPPSQAEVETFLREHRAKPQAAYESAVDRLLRSPHYGERWGRHWLDAARYADSNGYSIDAPRSIWPYRDWVIRALNADMPFDRFAVEQLAGDLLPNATLDQRVATGFHRNTTINQEGGINVEQFRIEAIVDRVATTGAVFLGLTIGCAQCHDHKFDPISQREYYQMFAFLNNCDEPNLELATPEQVRERDRVRKLTAILEKQRKQFDTYTAAKEDQWEKSLSPEARLKLPEPIQKILEVPENGRVARQKQTLTAYVRQLDLVRHAAGGIGNPLPFQAALHAEIARFRTTVERQLADLKKKDPTVTTSMVLQERKTPRMTNLMLGGDFLRPGVRVEPGVPSILHSLSATKNPSRLDLARWIMDAENPLTSRVMVNRAWQAFFGTGLVETDNDFGTQGTPPTHPELLDWLATEFQARGWSMKVMHKLMVTSATYRQSSRARPDLATVDPRNRLLARQSRVRLEAEIVRDVALSASGLLVSKIGGPSVYPPQPEGIYKFTQVPRDWKPNAGEDRYRRGMYTYFWRSAPHPNLIAFDAPDATNTCTRRNRSNTPLQALTLLNEQGFHELAQGLAERIQKESQPDDLARIRHAFRLALSREPRPAEAARLHELVRQSRLEGDTEATCWLTVSRVLLNLDEFITRE